MADYSGYSDPITVGLSTHWLKHNGRFFGPLIWDSWKDFSRYPAGTESKLLDFLIDGHKSRMQRNGKYIVSYTRPKIIWIKERNTFRLINGYRFSDKDGIDWLQRHGYLDDENNVLREFA